MNSLVQVTDGQIVVESRKIAEHFGKEHKNVMQSVREILAAEKSATKFYLETTYENRGKEYPEYLMNRDGFSLLVMGFTGKKALEWKIKYIQAFNAMEEELRNPSKTNILPKDRNEFKEQELKTRMTNARVRESNQYLKIAAQIDIPEYRYILQAKAAEALNGGVPVLPLQEVERKTYSATEIGAMFGVSANKIGKLANEHKLKTPEYGKLFYSKSEHSVKEVETWRYYDSVIPVFEKIFGREAA
jgi:phage regulatory protein, rha family|nr:MAG TPA: regulatory protein [Caudoviricetes sp.]